MKLTNIVTILVLAGVSSAAPAANFSNLGCQKKWYEDFSGLIHNINVFRNDNRGPISVRGPEEGLTARDIKQANENIGIIFCPTSTPGLFNSVQASIIGSNDQLVTNKHAFMDDEGKIFDPLSKCVFRQQALTDGRGLIDHALNLKDGVEGLKQLEAMGILKLGTYPANLKDDYAVVKLKRAIPWVKPYRMSQLPVELHGCKKEEPCQQIVSISAYQEQMKMKVKHSDLILQTSDLKGLVYAHDGLGSIIYSDTSATDGASGTLQFLRDDEGKLVRGADGALLPIAILARSKNKSADGQDYDAKKGIGTLSVGLDSKVFTDIQVMANKTQTAENPNDQSLPDNNEGI